MKRYQDLYDAYLTQRDLIPIGRLHELSFESLVSSPIDEMRRIYDELQIESTTNLQPKWQAYLEQVAGHKVDRHPALDESEQRLVAARWRKYLDAFEYAWHGAREGLQ